MSHALSLLATLRRHPALRSLARRALHLSRDVRDEARYGVRRLTRNLPAQWQFDPARAALAPAEARVAADLSRDGIAIISARELLGPEVPLDEVVALAAGLAPAKSGKAGASGSDLGKWEKEYLLRLHADGVTLGLDHPLLQIGLQSAMLNPINAYLGLPARLNYVNCWYTPPAGADRPAGLSQVWHRDPEDKKLVKVFLYTSDVDETSGPLQYVPGSKLSGGRYSQLWRRRSQLYPDLAQFHRRIPTQDIVTCTVPAGTMVFVDTSGFHRGGLATGRPRMLATWMYVTPAAFEQRRFILESRDGLSALPAPAREALA